MKKTIKTILTATMIAVSGGLLLGSYTTTAVAAETSAGVNQAIADLKKVLAEGIRLASEGNNQQAVIDVANEAKQVFKEITGDQYGAKLQRLGGYLRKARGMAKRGDLAGAEEEFKKALDLVNQFPRA